MLYDENSNGKDSENIETEKYIYIFNQLNH